MPHYSPKYAHDMDIDTMAQYEEAGKRLAVYVIVKLLVCELTFCHCVCHDLVIVRPGRSGVGMRQLGSRT